MDGGTDSLVVGDEPGLGDPVEDAVSVQSVAALTEVPLRLLVCAGLGVDRHNGVSDLTSLRAIADLTRLGGFLGALALERDDDTYRFYRDAVVHLLERRAPGAGSIVARAIVEAVDGGFGWGGGRAAGPTPDSLFVWPLMALVWAFDVDTVAARSRVGAWIRDIESPTECTRAVREGRRRTRIRPFDSERLPDPEPWPLTDLFD